MCTTQIPPTSGCSLPQRGLPSSGPSPSPPGRSVESPLPIPTDFVEMLSALSDAGADHLLVGAHALAVHGRPRATGDLDLWIRPTPDNADRVWQAFIQFGAPLQDLGPADLQEPDIVIQFGVSPVRIDILTSLSGLDFQSAWERRETVQLSGLQVPVLAREDLILNKRTTGRLQDLADVEALERPDPQAP